MFESKRDDEGELAGVVGVDGTMFGVGVGILLFEFEFDCEIAAGVVGGNVNTCERTSAEPLVGWLNEEGNDLDKAELWLAVFGVSSDTPPPAVCNLLPPCLPPLALLLLLLLFVEIGLNVDKLLSACSVGV